MEVDTDFSQEEFEGRGVGGERQTCSLMAECGKKGEGKASDKERGIRQEFMIKVQRGWGKKFVQKRGRGATHPWKRKRGAVHKRK